MRYYKRSPRRNFVSIIILAAGLVFVSLAAVSTEDIDSSVIFAMCGAVFIISGWVVRKGQTHYLEIDDEKIVHRGFRQWTIMKSDVTRVERGRKGWLDEKELYFRIYVQKKSYEIDDGFLPDEEHVQELAKAIGSR
jgi:hypothetical protein